MLKNLDIKGNTLVKIGSGGEQCSADLSVPNVCQECRQIKRWTRRFLSWARARDSAIGAILRSILKADDDILASLCGFCYLKDESEMTPLEACECLVTKFCALGLSLTVPAATTKFLSLIHI